MALAILAVLATTLVFQGGSFGSQLFRLEEKTVALWVAQNALDEARLEQPLAAERKPVEVEMGGRTWVVSRTVSPTERAGFDRIEVSVAREGEDDAVISLTGFVAEQRP